MAMQYVNYLAAKAHIDFSHKSARPVLSDEDEQFLNRISSQQNPPAFVDHGGDAQVALMNGAQNIALPPVTPNELVEVTKNPPEQDKIQSKPKTSRSSWSWMRRDSRDGAAKKAATAEGLQSIVQDLKSRTDETAEEAEARKEEEEMTIALDRLNLAAVNNRVFSISSETQDLLQKFTQVLKDLVNGVPTAYRDLESLLTNGDKQIQKTYNSLPDFLKKLIEKLPQTMTKGLAPEMMAAAAARASSYGINLDKAGRAAGAASKFMTTPSLKDLVTKPGAVTAMLRSIMQFLETRFPAFAGINVLWSMALFLLLIVFWYCYKRGREVRLEKERALTEQEVEQLEKDYDAYQAQNPTPGEVRPPLTTMAADGASIDEVRAGMAEAYAARLAAAQASQATT